MVETVEPETERVPSRREPATGPSAAAGILQLLREAHVSRRSGHLHLTHGREYRGLTVREGHVVLGRSDANGEHLGDVLVRHNLLGRAELDRAVATVLAERRPLGAVLVGLSLVDRDRLEEAIGWHVREILFAALARPSGSASFEEIGGLPGSVGEGGLVSSLATGQLLLEAARTLSDPALVRETLGDLDRKLTLPAEARLLSQPLALTPTDAFVFSRIDGTLSARDLARLGPIVAEETERSLLALLCAGAVVPVDVRPVRRRARVLPPEANLPAPPNPRSRSAPEPSSPPPASPPPTPPASAAEAGPAAPSARGSEEMRRVILEAYESLGRTDHFELLGVRPDADAAEVRSGYARLVRCLHPDACRDPLLADVEVQREAVFLRVCRAYEILRDPAARAAYREDVRRRRPRRASPVPSEAPPPPSAPPTLPSPPSPSAPPSSPRMTPSSPPVPPSSPPPRAKAAAEPTVRVATLEERLAETIAGGEALLRDGQYWEAIQQLEPTLQHARGDLRVRARLALAIACLRNPMWVRRAEAHLKDALAEDPSRAEAYLFLGHVYRDGGLRARAAAMYRKVLELEPGNRLARRELGHLEDEASTREDEGPHGRPQKP